MKEKIKIKVHLLARMGVHFSVFVRQGRIKKVLIPLSSPSVAWTEKTKTMQGGKRKLKLSSAKTCFFKI